MSNRQIALGIVVVAAAIVLLWQPELALSVWQSASELAAQGLDTVRDLTTSEADKRASLLPEVQPAFDRLRAAAAAAGIDFHLVSAIRTADEQADNLAKGASATSHSWHLLGRAVDLWVLDPETGAWDSAGRREDLYRRLHLEIAAPLGWQTIAFNPDGSARYIQTSKGRTRDLAHLQYTSGLTWADAAAQIGYVVA